MRPPDLKAKPISFLLVGWKTIGQIYRPQMASHLL